MTLAVDCGEILAGLLLLGTLALLEARRPGWAAVALSAGTLARESVLGLAAAAFLAGYTRQRDPPWYVGAAPLGVWLAWQGFLVHTWGHPALAETSGMNLAAPLSGFLALGSGVLAGGTPRQAATLAWVVLTVPLFVHHSRGARGRLVLFALVLYGLAALHYSSFVWSAPNSLVRVLYEPSLLGAVLVLRAPRPWPGVAFLPSAAMGLYLLHYDTSSVRPFTGRCRGGAGRAPSKPSRRPGGW